MSVIVLLNLSKLVAKANANKEVRSESIIVVPTTNRQSAAAAKAPFDMELDTDDSYVKNPMKGKNK
jgi:hypothetical protein